MQATFSQLTFQRTKTNYSVGFVNLCPLHFLWFEATGLSVRLLQFSVMLSAVKHQRFSLSTHIIMYI